MSENAPWWLRRVSVVVSLYLGALSWHAAATTNPRDLAALNRLRNYWSGPYSNLPEWSGGDPCGTQWLGVTCSGAAGDQVTSLSLPSCNLTGGIPADIGSLASLQNLELSFNPFLGGTLPLELGQLTSLQSLKVMQCGLTGSIPTELGQCVNLTDLSLNQNMLTGKIPPSIGYLTDLGWFDISENMIEGPLPVSTSTSDGVGLDNLTSAKHFHFNNNSISGGIPEEMFNLPKLVHMLLDGNSLQGTIPTNLGNASGLQILRLDSNHLSGQLPAELNQLTSLLELHLSNNSFSQSLPNMSGLTKLQFLDVRHNQFAPQQVPSWIYSMDSLQTLFMDFAGLYGPLDPRIFSLASIQTLSLSNNELNGVVIFNSNSPSSLTLIDLQNNNFSGSQGSPTVNGLKSLSVELRLAGNPFCSDPNYSGSQVCMEGDDVPAFWSANDTCGTSCQDGKTLNPNMCSCSFPLACDMQLTTPAFQTVNGSVITRISEEFAGGFGLDDRQVYIGFANFSDNSRMFFNLLFFPLSGDSLSNSVVKNVTAGLSARAVGLKEGPYLLRSVNATVSVKKSKSKTNVGLIVGIVAAVVLFAIIMAAIGLYALRQKRRADKAEVSRPFASWGASAGNPGEAPQLKGARWFSLAELQKATNNFSTESEIGAGGYGKVYKAILPSGDVVAVKRAEEGCIQGATQFKNEIELLSRVHHKHLVGLVGFCYEQGEQMLCYEYISNGTLRDHLLGHTAMPLPWESRVAIALGSARGIAYLHEMANPPIIHRDIKSSNILLDDKYVAKVSDFGLSKLASDAEGKRHVSTQVKGTLGYLDPNYYMTNHLTEKSDVYSFGVLLLEILSARQPIERGRYIVREVRTALDKGGVKMLDPLLDPLLGNYPQKQLEAFLNLALRCVEENADDRPGMNEVVKELEVIAGQSQPNSAVHITIEPQQMEDELYGRPLMKNENELSFQYSGAGFVPGTVEPK